MASVDIPVTAHIRGGRQIVSNSLLRGWVNGPGVEQVIFRGTDAGDEFSARETPPKSRLTVRGPRGIIGTVTSSSNSALRAR